MFAKILYNKVKPITMKSQLFGHDVSLNKRHMSKEYEYFTKMSDQELVQRLVATPADEKLHSFFFKKKCKNFLNYISKNIYHCESENQLWGELYEFLSKGDWAVVRKWNNRNGATLYSYLACCATNYFINKKVADKKAQEVLFTQSEQNVYEQFSQFADDEEEEALPVMEAYNMLCDRDRTILRLLVIEEQSALDAAPEIWKYIKCNRSFNEMEPKRVQCTISMAKHRAQLSLLNNLKQMIKLKYQ